MYENRQGHLRIVTGMKDAGRVRGVDPVAAGSVLAAGET